MGLLLLRHLFWVLDLLLFKWQTDISRSWRSSYFDDYGYRVIQIVILHGAILFVLVASWRLVLRLTLDSASALALRGFLHALMGHLLLAN